MIGRIKSLLTLLGINIDVAFRNVSSIGWFFSDYKKLKKQLKGNTDFKLGKWYPMLGDKGQQSGEASGHYFHQDLLVAQKVFTNNPNKHVDVGSSVAGLVAHIASFREIDVFDIRPLSVNIENINFIAADFMQVDSKLHNYCDSLSCLHVIEHFGLGRYNDPINVNGHLVGLDNMYNILKKGGKFYFSTPIGPQRIEFNAHRVFEVSYLLRIFNDKYTINSFSFVDDSGALHRDVKLEEEDINRNFGCNFGCGIFEMTKI